MGSLKDRLNVIIDKTLFISWNISKNISNKGISNKNKQVQDHKAVMIINQQKHFI